LNINVYSQLFSLFIFALTGIAIGILFDIFRIIRKSFKTPDFITYLEDILFWILTGFILLFTIFTFNNGEIRVYIFIGLIFGIITYMLTLSKYFINISVNILRFVKRILSFPIHIICNFINKFIFRPIIFILQKNKIKIAKKDKKSTENVKIPNICNKFDK